MLYEVITDFRQRIVREPAHVLAGRFVTQHQGVRLGAVDKAQGDPGEGGMEQRALPFLV